MVIKKKHDNSIKIQITDTLKKILDEVAAEERRLIGNMVVTMIQKYCEQRGKSVPVISPPFPVDYLIHVGIRPSIKRLLKNAAIDQNVTMSEIVQALIKKYYRKKLFTLQNPPPIRERKSGFIHLELTKQTAEQLTHIIASHNRSISNVVEMLTLMDAERI